MDWFNKDYFVDCRVLSTLPEKAEISQEVEVRRPAGRRPIPNEAVLESRHIYPEFLPDPNPDWRNSLREKLERADMLKRRSQIDIPEFYVGKFSSEVPTHDFICSLMH